MAYLLPMIIFGTLLLVLMASVLVSFMLLHRQHRRRYEMDLLQTRIEVQDKALDWASREFHDNIGQVLSITKMEMTHELESKTAPELKMQVKEWAGRINSCLNDLHNLNRSLNPDMIEKIGFIDSLNQELAHVQSLHKISCRLNADKRFPDLSSVQELLLFRIAQESLHNIIRHADASEIIIDLVEENGQLIMIIADNGTGFDPGAGKPGNGMGLTNMKHRARLLNGNCDINTTPGEGTRVVLNIRL